MHLLFVKGPKQSGLPKESSGTAYVCNFFNQLFVSVNGNSVKAKDGIPSLRTAVSAKSQYVRFWKDACVVLRNMCFVAKGTTKPTRPVPSLLNWTSTLRGMEALWNRLQGMGLQYLKPRMVNQALLENFFCSIRAHGHRFVSPTCWQFDGLCRTLLVNNVSSVHSIGANCATDDGHFLLSLESFLKDGSEQKTTASSSSVDDNTVLPETPQQYEEKTNGSNHPLVWRGLACAETAEGSARD